VKGSCLRAKQDTNGRKYKRQSLAGQGEQEEDGISSSSTLELPTVQTADVVLAMRSHMKAGSWAREAAKEAGTPVYAVKNGADSTLVHALETLLGSANGVVGAPRPAAAAVQYQNHVVSMVSSFTVGKHRGYEADFELLPHQQESGLGNRARDWWGRGREANTQEIGGQSQEPLIRSSRTLGEEDNHCCHVYPLSVKAWSTSTTLLQTSSTRYATSFVRCTYILSGPHRRSQKDHRTRPFSCGHRSEQCLNTSQSSASNEAEALEEAAQAIEKVVLPTMKPIELLPRSAQVLAKQISLVEGSYKFATQVVGKGAQARLRILPSMALSNGGGTSAFVDPAVA